MSSQTQSQTCKLIKNINDPKSQLKIQQQQKAEQQQQRQIDLRSSLRKYISSKCKNQTNSNIKNNIDNNFNNSTKELLPKLSILNLHQNAQTIINIVTKSTNNLISKYTKESLGAVIGNQIFKNKQINVQQKFKEDLYYTIEQISIYSQAVQEIIQQGTLSVENHKNNTTLSKTAQQLRKVQHQLNNSLFKIIKFLDRCLRDHLSNQIKTNLEVESLINKNFLTCERCGELRQKQKIEATQFQMLYGFKSPKFSQNQAQRLMFKQKTQGIYSKDTCLDADQMEQKIIKIENGLNQRFYTMTQCIQDLENIYQSINYTDDLKKSANAKKYQTNKATSIQDPFNPMSYEFQLVKFYNQIINKISLKLNQLIQKFQISNKKVQKVNAHAQTSNNYVNSLQKQHEKQKNYLINKYTSDMESKKLDISNLKIQLHDFQNSNKALITQKCQLENEKSWMIQQKKQHIMDIQMLKNKIKIIEAQNKVQRKRVSKFKQNIQPNQKNEQDETNLIRRTSYKKKTTQIGRQKNRTNNKNKTFVNNYQNNQNNQAQIKYAIDLDVLKRIKKAKLKRDYFSAFSGLKRHQNVVIVQKNDIQIQYNYELELDQHQQKTRNKQLSENEYQTESKVETKFSQVNNQLTSQKSFRSTFNNNVSDHSIIPPNLLVQKLNQIPQSKKNHKNSTIVQSVQRNSYRNTKKIPRKTIEDRDQFSIKQLKTIEQNQNVQIKNNQKTEKKFYKDSNNPYHKLFLLNRAILPQDITLQQFKIKIQKHINNLNYEENKFQIISQNKDPQIQLRNNKIQLGFSQRNSIKGFQSQQETYHAMHSYSGFKQKKNKSNQKKDIQKRQTLLAFQTNKKNNINFDRISNYSLQKLTPIISHSPTNHTQANNMTKTFLSKISFGDKSNTLLKSRNLNIEKSSEIMIPSFWKAMRNSQLDQSNNFCMRNSIDQLGIQSLQENSNKAITFNEEDIKEFFFSMEKAYSFQQQKNLPKIKRYGNSHCYFLSESGRNIPKSSLNLPSFKKCQISYTNQLLGVIATLHSKYPKDYDIVKNFLISPYQTVANQRPFLQTMKSQQFSSLLLKESINALILIHRGCQREKVLSKENPIQMKKTKEIFGTDLSNICPHLKKLLRKVIKINIKQDNIN